MSKVYTIAFRMGVLFNILLWTILNVVSFKKAESEFFQRRIERERSGLNFPCCDYIGSWGVPFDWTETYFVIGGAGTILNIIIMTACGFAFGFLFKFVWSKISRRGVGLNGAPSS